MKDNVTPTVVIKYVEVAPTPPAPSVMPELVGGLALMVFLSAGIAVAFTVAMPTLAQTITVAVAPTALAGLATAIAKQYNECHKTR